MREPNYFLYVVGREGEGDHLTPGNCGVGRTSIGPGVHDAPYGTMYIITAEDMFKHSGQRRAGADTIKRAILSFYGVKLAS